MADLITLTEYKEIEGITSTQHDARTEVIIDSVSQLVKTYCGNSIIDFHTSRTTKTENITISYPTKEIQLEESPLISVTSLKERGNPTNAYTTLTENTEFVIDKTTDIIHKLGSNWLEGVSSIEVIYNAGYVNTPADLKLAVADLVTHYLKGEHKERRTIQGANIQNQRSDLPFPDHIKRVLDLYKTY